VDTLIVMAVIIYLVARAMGRAWERGRPDRRRPFPPAPGERRGVHPLDRERRALPRQETWEAPEARPAEVLGGPNLSPLGREWDQAGEKDSDWDRDQDWLGVHTGRVVAEPGETGGREIETKEEAVRHWDKKTRRRHPFLGRLGSRDLARALIMSEVLGPPRAQRGLRQGLRR